MAEVINLSACLINRQDYVGKWVAIRGCPSEHVIVYGDTQEEVVVRLKNLFARLQKCGMSGEEFKAAQKEFLNKFTIFHVE